MMRPKLPAKMINKEARPISQLPVITNMPKAIGTDNNPAVNAANCLGDKFLVENIMYKTTNQTYNQRLLPF